MERERGEGRKPRGKMTPTKEKLTFNVQAFSNNYLFLNISFRKFGIKRLVISTYQSVSGTGVAAVKQMDDERKCIASEMVYPYPIDKNCLPHGGDFEDNGYTTEETKLVNETRKILGDSSIQITATVVRVPVIGGHSESVNIETKKPFKILEKLQIRIFSIRRLTLTKKWIWGIQARMVRLSALDLGVS